MERARSGDNLAVVEVVSGALKAEMRKSLLESYGIPVMIRSQMITNMVMREINVGPMGEVQILVPASRADEARVLLRELDHRPEFVNGDTVEERVRAADRGMKILFLIIMLPLLAMGAWSFMKEYTLANR